MQSKATTVAAYLAELPADRRREIEAVRAVIKANLDKGYEEGMLYGMIGYFVPHRLYPAGYHCDPKQPLGFTCLASQKNYMSLYMMCVYGDNAHAQWFKSAWAKTGKKLDMGKSCIRFKKAEDLALDVIGESIRRMPVKKYIEYWDACLEMMGKSKKSADGKSKSSRPAKKSAKPKAAKSKAAKPKVARGS